MVVRTPRNYIEVKGIEGRLRVTQKLLKGPTEPLSDTLHVLRNGVGLGASATMGLSGNEERGVSLPPSTGPLLRRH